MNEREYELATSLINSLQYDITKLKEENSKLREDLREDLREGISLRDHFAGLAMQEFIALFNFKTGLIVTMSYEMADAMLERREKKK